MATRRTRLNRQTTFALLVITQTGSLLGSRMTGIALGLWLFAATGNTAPLLLMAFFNELPGVLAGGIAGVWVDRLPRRRVLLLADAGQAAGSLLLLVSFLSGRFQIWHLYFIVFGQGLFAIFQQPARDAVTTLLVADRHRERANAVQQMAFPLAGVVAPAVTGALYVFIGIAGVILVDLATFLAAVTVLFFLRLPQPRPTAEAEAIRGSAWRELGGVLRFLLARRLLFGLLLYMTAVNFLLNGPLELAIPYLLTISGSEAATGLLLSAMSLGAFAGAALIAAWGGTRPRLPTLLGGLLITGVMFLVYGTARTPLLLGLSLFLLMVPLPAANTLLTSILQVKIPPDMQGRVFALVGQMGFLGATLSFLSVGPLVDRVLEPAVDRPAWALAAPLVGRQAGSGIGLLLVTTGAVILLLTLPLLLSRRFRGLEASLIDYEAAAAEDG